MKEEELPKHLQDVLKNLKHGSITIDCDITDSLNNADSVKDFQKRVSNAMDNIIGEAEYLKKNIVSDKEQKSIASEILTIEDARQVAFETLRSVVTLHGWENIKDLVGRQLDMTDEMLDQAVNLLFSDKNKT